MVLFKLIEILHNHKIQHLWAFLLYYLIRMMVLMMSSLISFQIIQAKNSEGASKSRQKTLSWKSNWKSQISAFEEALTDMSSEMEAGMEGLALEGSSQEEWENLFRKCPEAWEIIVHSVDFETALTCRLVCKKWRETVNRYRKLWAKIIKVFSIAVKL